jgi:hypothetical protein
VPFNRPAGWDADGDGMPDAWEIEHGLNPNVANNNGDFDTPISSSTAMILQAVRGKISAQPWREQTSQ